MPTRFGLSGFNLLLGGVETAASAAQFTAGALIVIYIIDEAAASAAQFAA
jgi:hypothetical protein